MVDLGSTQTKEISTVLVFGRTPAIARDLKDMIASDTASVEPLTYCTALDQVTHLGSASVIIVEVDVPAVLNEGLELVKQIRLKNVTASVFMVITHPKSFVKVNCYLAGADHCVKLPVDPAEKVLFLAALLSDPEWTLQLQLILDRAFLCLYGHEDKLEISYTEMKILDALVSAHAHILSHDEIASALELNIKSYDPRALEKTISRLRGKIRDLYKINAIHNVRGFGYRLGRGVIS